MLGQMQEVHEQRGCVASMAVSSRGVLAAAALTMVLTALGLNVADGGSSLLVVAVGSCIILLVFTWYMFEASSKSTKHGSTVVKASYASGTSHTLDSQDSLQHELPDPLEAGIEIPLM